MSYHQIIFAPDSVWDTMNNLAHNEHVMLCQTQTPKFKSNSPLIHYANTMIKRCDEVFEELNKIEHKMQEYDMPLGKFLLRPADYIKFIDQNCERKQILGNDLLEKIDGETQKKFAMLNNQLETHDQIIKKRLFCFEKKNAYQVMNEINNFDERPADFYLMMSGSTWRKSSGEDVNNRVSKLEKRFNLIFGTVPTENSLILHKLVFRLARENVMIRMKNLDEIDDKYCRKASCRKPKTLMFLLFQRGETNIIYEKVKHTLSRLEFTELEIPNSWKRTEMMFEIHNELEDNEKILNKTEKEIKSILWTFSQSSEIEGLSYLCYLRLLFKREQNFALNYRYLDQKDGCYQMHIFLPRSQVPILVNNLNSIRPEDPNFARPKIIEIVGKENWRGNTKEPTLFKLTEFMEPFQLLVSTYGVPRYKEINPAVFTIISFPFFFGLMFGDIGHGLILLLVGMYILLKGERSLSQVSPMLVLMGFFAVFSGIIYNEFFSIPFPLGSSCYNLETRERWPDCIYDVGIDWIWSVSKNETPFINSFKMKFSIIIGVLQMLLGTFLKGMNAVHFRNYLDLFCEAIPQFLLMSVTFGYMAFCILVKWMTDWTGKESISIIQLFINFYHVDQELYGPPGLQQTLQISFICIALASVLIMLLIKPLVLGARKPIKKKSVHSLLKESDSDPEHSLMHNVS